MSDRQALLYFAWSRPGETQAPLTVIDDRFPAIFELRRLFYPEFERFAIQTASIKTSLASWTTCRSTISSLSRRAPRPRPAAL